MSMRRRRILSVLGAWVVFLPGCVTNSKSISITVQNFASETAEITLKLVRDENERYENTVTVPPDRKVHLKEVADGGKYTLTVSTDEFGDQTRPISMNGCDEQEISVAVLPSEDIDIQLKRC